MGTEFSFYVRMSFFVSFLLGLCEMPKDLGPAPLEEEQRLPPRREFSQLPVEKRDEA